MEAAIQAVASKGIPIAITIEIVAEFQHSSEAFNRLAIPVPPHYIRETASIVGRNRNRNGTEINRFSLPTSLPTAQCFARASFARSHEGRFFEDRIEVGVTSTSSSSSMYSKSSFEIQNTGWLEDDILITPSSSYVRELFFANWIDHEIIVASIFANDDTLINFVPRPYDSSARS